MSKTFFLLAFSLLASIAIAYILILPADAQADTRYVKVGGTGDGTSWATASGTLQAMINAVETAGGGTVCAASGTYMPTTLIQPGTPRSAAFQMKNSVGIYGGFPNSGSPSWANRDWETYQTILSGDIGAIGNNADNCYHVFYHPTGINLDGTAILDGFTISAGYAETVSGNSVDWYGGGMHNSNSSPQVTNCTFSGNSADWYGGGMYNWDSSPQVTNCTFSGNSAGAGGGMSNDEYSSTTVTNCIFSGNSADIEGGGMHNWDSSPVVTNCTFSLNWSNWDGGGMYNFKANPEVTNCTFSENRAYYRGGGISNYISSPTVTNCILWGDSASSGNEIFNDTSFPVITYCDVEGGYTGAGNINTDPLWVNPGAGDFHLQPTSPCIDSGSNAAIQATGVTEDFEGDLRIVNGIVDMGVDESCYYNLSISSSTGGSVTFPGEGLYPFDCGTAVAIVAQASPCYSFMNWSGSGTPSIANPGLPNTTITLDGDYSIQANFSLDTYTLTIGDDGNGTTTPAGGDHIYDCGTAVAVNATPNTCYIFDQWIGDAAAYLTNPATQAANSVTIPVGGGSLMASFTPVPEINITGEADFGNVTAVPGPEGAVSHDFTIENICVGDLNLTGTPVVAIVGGTNPQFFAVTVQPGTVVPGGSGTAIFTVRFDPDGVGGSTAILSIANNDPDENPYIFEVRGNGEEKVGGGGPTVGGEIMVVNKTALITRLIGLPVRLLIGLMI